MNKKISYITAFLLLLNIGILIGLNNQTDNKVLASDYRTTMVDATKMGTYKAGYQIKGWYVYYNDKRIDSNNYEYYSKEEIKFFDDCIVVDIPQIGTDGKYIVPYNSICYIEPLYEKKEK